MKSVFSNDSEPRQLFDINPGISLSLLSPKVFADESSTLMKCARFFI
jgi:hypothetical protein